MGILSEMAEWRKGWRESSGYACVSKADLEVLLRVAAIAVENGLAWRPNNSGDADCVSCVGVYPKHAAGCEWKALEEKLTGPRLDKGGGAK